MNTEIYVKVGDVSQVIGGTATGKISGKVTSISDVKLSDDTNYVNTNNISRVDYEVDASSSYNISEFKLRNATNGSSSPVIDYTNIGSSDIYVAFEDQLNIVDGYNVGNIVKISSGTISASFSTGFTVSTIASVTGGICIASDKLVKYDSNLNIVGSFATVSTNGIINTICLTPDNSILVGGSFSLVNGNTVSNIFKCDTNGVLDLSISSLNNGTNGEVVQILVQSALPSTASNIAILGNFTEYDNLEENRIVLLNPSNYIRRTYSNSGFKTEAVSQDVNDIIFKKKCSSDISSLYGSILIGIDYLDTMLYNDIPIKKLLEIGIDSNIINDFIDSDLIQYNEQRINNLSRIVNNGDPNIFMNIQNVFSGNHFTRYSKNDSIVDIIYNNTDDGSYYYIYKYILSAGPGLFQRFDYILGGYDKWLGVETGVTLNRNYSSNNLMSIKEDGDIKSIMASISSNTIRDIAVDSFGRIYIYMASTGTYNGVSVPKLFRLLPDYTLDTTFDASSLSLLLSSPLTNLNKDYIRIDPVDPNRIYVLGIDHNIIRVLDDGSVDSTFTPSVALNGCFKFLPLSSGKIIVGLFISSSSSTVKLLNDDGSVDGSFSTISLDTSMRNIPDRIFSNNNEDLFIITGYFNTVNGSTYNGIVSFDITGTLDSTFFNTQLLAYNDNNDTQVFDDVLYIYDRSITFPTPFNTYKFTPFGYLIKIDIYTGDLIGEIYDDNLFTKMDSLANTPRLWIRGNDVTIPRIYLQYKDLSTSNLMLSVLDILGSTLTLNNSYTLDRYFVDNGQIISNGYNLILEDYKNTDVYRGGITYAKAAEEVDANISNICNLDLKGLLKSTFNQGTGFNDVVHSAKLLSNGKIVCVGNFNTYNGVSANRIAFLNQDGTLDTATMANVGVGFVNPCYKVIERLDTNKIIVVGGFTQYKGVSVNRIIQLNLNGTVDTSITGITTGANGDIFDIKHDQVNNKFYIGGRFTQYNGVSRNSLACLTSNLALNTGFAVGTGFSGGTAPSQVKAVYALEIQPDGKLLVGSNYTIYNGTTIQCLTRHNTNGTLDSTFQTNLGTGPVGVYGVIKAIKLLPDGRIVVGGNFQSFNGNTVANMARISSTGVYDSTFNTNTLFNSIQTGGSGSFDVAEVFTIALQSDGKMLVGGSFLTAPATVYFNKGVQRINVDGSLDLSYGQVDLQNSFVGVSRFTWVNEINLNPSNNDIIVVGRFNKYHYVGPTSNTSGGIQVVNSNIYQKLTLFKDEDILVNFILKDANDLSKIFSTYTQTFTIPADDNNLVILGYYFNTELARSGKISFDAKIYIKKSLFKIGTIEIVNGNYERNRLVSFTITFSTGVGLLLKLMGTDKLSDLNFDNIGFNYNKDWVYNQIQNGSLSNDVQVPLISTDRVWSYNDGALFDIKPGSGKAITFKELKPAIRFDSIMQTIINKYSLNVDCPLFSRDEYRKMFIWLNSLSTEKKRKVVLPLGVYSNIGNSYFFTETNLPEDYYLIRVFNTNYNVNRRMTIMAQLLDLRDNTTGDVLADTDITIYYVDKNTNTNLAVITAKTNSIGTLQTNWTIPQPSVTTDYYIRFFAESNEVIRYNSFNIVCKTNDTSPSVTPVTSALQGLYYEPKFDISNYLGDISVLDFFGSFFKMFNISVIENNITNKMTFLTPDELYTNTLDYTEFVDIKSHTIKPQPAYKTYDFKYIDSEYFRNYEFKKLVGLEYGELKYNRNDIGTSGEYIIEPKFGIMNYFYLQSNLGALNLKTSYGFIGGEDKDATTQLYKPYKPKGLTLMYIEDKIPITVNGATTSVNFSKTTGITPLTNYIRFGNQEDLVDANNDNSLTFSVDVEDVYGSFTKNLFTNYYDSTIQRIVNGNTRTFTISAVLPTYEINRFSLRNIIIIGDRRFTIDSATINIITGDTKLVLTNIATSPIKFN